MERMSDFMHIHSKVAWKSAAMCKMILKLILKYKKMWKISKKMWKNLCFVGIYER